MNRGAPARSQPLNIRSPENKVAGPAVAARVKESGDLAGQRVDSGQVRTLVQVTPMTGQRKIRENIETTMLFRNDVLDVVEHISIGLA